MLDKIGKKPNKLNTGLTYVGVIHELAPQIELYPKICEINEIGSVVRC